MRAVISGNLSPFFRILATFTVICQQNSHVNLVSLFYFSLPVHHFDRENTLTLEYILTERIKLEVETGVSQSVDLTYTVEK